LTVVVALVIGTIQLLTLILNVAYPNGPEDPFWDGVAVAGDNYDVIGGGICGSFIVVGLASVVAYKPWRKWVEAKRERRIEMEGDGRREEDTEEANVMDLRSGSGNEKRLENRKDVKKNVGVDRVEELDDRISSHVTEPL